MLLVLGGRCLQQAHAYHIHMADFKQQVSIKATSTRVDNIRHSETIEVAAAAVLKPE